MVEQHFCLRWNNYRTNITAEFEVLREGEHFVDVTLACDGQQLKAHKVVLSACSPYFKDLLQGNPCTHPIIILRDVGYLHMRGLLEFMYAGEVNVSQVHLASFLRTAEALKVRGLAEAPTPEQHSSVQQAATAAAAAMADHLLALKSSMGSLPLVPLSSPLTHAPQRTDSKGLHSIHVSNQTELHTNNNQPSNISSDSVDKSDIKSDMCGEPLSLTVNNNIQSKIHRSPSPHQCNKRLKCSHSNGGSGASSPPYYASATHSNGSTGDIPSEEAPHDLSNSSKYHCSPWGTKNTLSTANGSSNITAVTSDVTPTSATVASLPPTLASTSPDHLQYVFKSEPPDQCGGGSDTEGGCGGSWHEDSMGSEGELVAGETGGKDTGLVATAGGSDGGGISLGLPSGHQQCATVLAQHSPTTTSTSTSLHHLHTCLPASTSSPPPPLQPHLMHAAMPKQESHMAGIMRSLEPLPCPICKRSYSSPGNLKQHIENIHMATTEPSFECRICNNKFKSKWYLHKHLHRAHHIRGRKEP